MSGFIRSIRWRLTLWNACALFAILVIFAIGNYYIVRARILGQLYQDLERDLQNVVHVVRTEPNEVDELENHGTIPLFEVMEDGKILHRTAAWSTVEAGMHITQTAIVHDAGPTYTITAARDSTATGRTLSTLAMVFIILTICGAALALAAGYFLAGRVLAPFGALAAKVRAISAESLSARLSVENPHDEFGKLTININETLERLDESFERLRRFTADASHELRTPLTAMRSVGEVAMQSRHDETFYRDAVGSMLEEVNRLSRLVESLLELTRGDGGALQIKRELSDLGGLAKSVVECLRVLAEEKEQKISLDIDSNIYSTIDSTVVRQAVTNILDNAIQYSPRSGAIGVCVKRVSADWNIIEISDSGPGIPPEHRTKIFDRFYRIDPGRSRARGGAGLGLAIAKRAIERNGGRIEVVDNKTQGSVFRIFLPSPAAEK
ncbi:MAG: HAMP domain-containing protein [Planctomycetes bacterium]|nr:HAMP domain-containing protein [Planctomycetota bacterium]